MIPELQASLLLYLSIWNMKKNLLRICDVSTIAIFENT